MRVKDAEPLSPALLPVASGSFYPRTDLQVRQKREKCQEAGEEGEGRAMSQEPLGQTSISCWEESLREQQSPDLPDLSV